MEVGRPLSVVRENWERIQHEIKKAGGSGVRVLGVTKGQPLERLLEGVACGLTLLGDNYVQEGQRLREQLPSYKGEWHFIGHIQSRKARDLVAYDCVESLDRISVAEELNKRASRVIPVFAEVNVGEEVSKSGVRPEELEKFLDALKGFPSLRLEGLMALPPPLEPIEARRPHFQKLRQLFDRFSGSHGLKWLSLGTSDDYPLAVAEGANLLRLGTALFGPRAPRTG